MGVGYTLVYLFDVVRPGEQSDPVGGARPPLFFLGGANPQPNPRFNGFGESDFWAQGIHVRLEVSY